MNSEVEQNCDERPPREGAILSIEVDGTSRYYTLSALALGNHTPDTANKSGKRVRLKLHAEGGDVYYFFSSLTTGAVSTTAKQAATTATAAFAATYAARLPQNESVEHRIDRSVDLYLHVKGSGILRIYAASAAEF